jgi:hypothetical protein
MAIIDIKKSISYNNNFENIDTSFTLSNDDNLKWFLVNDNITVTVPNLLLIGFNCMFLIYGGDFTVDFIPDNAETFIGDGTQLFTQYKFCYLVKKSSNEFILSGNLK